MDMTMMTCETFTDLFFVCVCKPDSHALSKILGTVDAWEHH